MSNKENPIALILENYVRECIGDLPAADQDSVKAIVKKVFGGEDGDWCQITREQLGLQDSLDDQLRGMWKEAQAVVKKSGQTLAPLDFARMVVEENFADLIEIVSGDLEPAKN